MYRAMVKHTHTQSRTALSQLFSWFEEVSKCVLTVLFGNLKMKEINKQKLRWKERQTERIGSKTL